MGPRAFAVAIALLLMMTIAPMPMSQATPYASWEGGGDLIDAATTVCVAPDGDVLIAGTEVVEVPSYMDLLFGSSDLMQAFIMRLSPELDLRWKVSIGGEGGFHDSMLHGIDAGLRMTVLSDGSAALVGATSSEDGEFPITPGAVGGFGGCTDGFLVIVDEDGDIVYGTYVGGEGMDACTGVATTADGLVVVGGTNSSSIAGVENPHGGGDAFVATFVDSIDGWGLDGLTYLGSSGTDSATCVSVDGDIYVGGLAGSGFPSMTSMGPRDGRDAFVVRLTTSLDTVASLVIGGSGVDTAVSIIADDGIVLVGGSDSVDLSIDGASPDADGDCMVVRADAGLSTIDGTFIGGSASDIGTSVLPWADGRVLIGGISNSSDLPVTIGTGPSGQSSGFIAMLNGTLMAVSSQSIGSADASALVAMCADGSDALTVTLTSEVELPIRLLDDVSSLDPSDLLDVLADTDVDVRLERTDVLDVPGPVASLSAESGIGHVLLSWAPPAYGGDGAILRYDVERSDGPVVVVTDTSYDDVDVTDGLGYTYTVRAVSTSGRGEPGSVEAVPGDVPSAPPDLVGSAFNSYVGLSWSPPDDGGCAISAYTVRRDGAAVAELGAGGLTFEDDGMANGVAYTYSITASNVIGESDPSEIVMTPMDVPLRPSPTVAAGDGCADLSWTAPGDGGHPITAYRVYRIDEGPSLETETGTTTCRVGDLENGGTYRFAIAAVNSVGEGRMSDPMTVTPWALPGTPVSIVAEPGDSLVSISWSQPSDDGGFPVTAYCVERSLDGVTFEHLDDVERTWSVDTSAQNGQNLTYRISAVTAMGQGESAEVDVSLPERAPSEPSSLTATSGDSWVSLSWSGPRDDGGTDVTAYIVIRSVDGGDDVTIGLGPNVRSYGEAVENGVEYTYSVSAVNAIGTGRSATAIARPGGAPDAPMGLIAVVGDGWANLSWSPPTEDGGWPVLRYIVTGSVDVTVENTWCNLTGLENGVPVTFSVAAVNVVGAGPSANVSASPYGPPSRPVGLTASSGDGVTLTWSRPEDDGGSSLTSYRVLRGSSVLADLGTWELTYQDSDVPTGVVLSYSVVASNAAGWGEPSEVTVVHRTIPSAPEGLHATVDGSTITLSWDAPVDGGSPITGYEVTRDGGAATMVVTTSFEGGVDPGATYVYSVRALNVLGAGDDSNLTVVVPATAPSEPLHLSVDRTDDGTLVSWDPPADDGGGIVSYVVMRGETPDGMMPVAVVNGTSFLDAVDGACYAVVAVTAGGESSQVVVDAPADGSAWLAIPVLAVAALVIVLLWRRR